MRNGREKPGNSDIEPNGDNGKLENHGIGKFLKFFCLFIYSYLTPRRKRMIVMEISTLIGISLRE